MKRVQNWNSLLPSHTSANGRGKKFVWGAFDCALAACDSIKAITGVDPGENYRGKYSTAAEASAVIAQAGFATLGDFAAKVAAEYGMQEIGPRQARRGDLVFVNNRTPQGALGIVDLTGRRAACAAEHGRLLIPMGRWKRAWRVG
jgi:uncharacterized protein DUF6950